MNAHQRYVANIIHSLTPADLTPAPSREEVAHA